MSAPEPKRAGLAGTTKHQIAGDFTYRDVAYRYFVPDHIRILSAFTQARDRASKPVEVILFPADPAIKPQEHTLNLMQLERLLNEMDSAAKRQARVRYDEQVGND